MKRDLCIVYEGKLYLIVNIMHNCSHSLRGLCGLKLRIVPMACFVHVSQSARTVWIEISTVLFELTDNRSQSARTVWIEIVLF